MIFVLVRTDPTVPKHNGISYVLLDFKSAGVEYRPIKQMTGAAEFAEDFFDGARAPLFNVIGGLNNGWRVTMTTLTYERGGRATTGYLGFEREFWALIDTARKAGKDADPLVRQQLAWAYTQVSLMKFRGLRTLARLAAGQQPARGVHRQAVLERVLQAAGRDRGRDRGHPDAHPARGRGLPGHLLAGQLPGRPPRPASTPGRTRSSATSSASASWACPRSRASPDRTTTGGTGASWPGHQARPGGPGAKAAR